MPDWLWALVATAAFFGGGIWGSYLGSMRTLRDIANAEMKKLEDKVVHQWTESYERLSNNKRVENSTFYVPFVAKVANGQRVIDFTSDLPLEVLASKSPRVAEAMAWAKGGLEPDFFQRPRDFF